MRLGIELSNSTRPFEEKKRRSARMKKEMMKIEKVVPQHACGNEKRRGVRGGSTWRKTTSPSPRRPSSAGEGGAPDGRKEVRGRRRRKGREMRGGRKNTT